MAPAVLKRIADRAGTTHMALGTGPDAPDPDGAGLDGLTIYALDELTADADDTFPADWEAQLDAWPRPVRADLYRDRLHLGHHERAQGRDAHPRQHGLDRRGVRGAAAATPPRVVSLLPLSHLFEQAPVLLYGTMIGAEVHVRPLAQPAGHLRGAARDPRHHDDRDPPAARAVLDGRHARGRPAGQAGHLRACPHDRPTPPLRRAAAALPVHPQAAGWRVPPVRVGRRVPAAGAPALAGRTWASWCSRGTAPPNADPPRRTRSSATRRASWASPSRPSGCKLAEGTSEILVAGPTVSPGYWQDPEATAAAFEPDGWYHTGDIGHFDERRATWCCRAGPRTSSCCRTASTCSPRTSRRRSRTTASRSRWCSRRRRAASRRSCCHPARCPSSRPGEAARRSAIRSRTRPVRAEIERIVKAVNGDLSIHQRIDAWRLWPEPDFPRTHTLKIRRDAVREWAASDIPIQVRDAACRVSDAALIRYLITGWPKRS